MHSRGGLEPIDNARLVPTETQKVAFINGEPTVMDTCDHRQWKIWDPVRSPLIKPLTAGVVVGSVTTSECPVLHVLVSFSFPHTFCLLSSWQRNESAMLVVNMVGFMRQCSGPSKKSPGTIPFTVHSILRSVFGCSSPASESWEYIF